MVFKVDVEAKNVVEWTADYFKAQPNAKGAVLGISGGKDSAACAAILAEAIGPDRVLGVMLPNGVQNDIDDSKGVINTLGIESKTVNISSAYNAVVQSIEEPGEFRYLSEQAMINIAPRIRMTTLYAIASHMHYRVAGTGNLSEGMVGYTTKFGDLACDFNPIQYFTTDEVSQIAEYLKIPRAVAYKTPSDGLCGKSDEDNMGISYKDINTLINGGVDDIPHDVNKKIIEKHNYNLHKVSPIPCYVPKFRDIELAKRL